ncbi:hypothetical protein A3Q56_06348 [Intoshia linei]|uniref:Cleavage and polyadenylation specificity factor subunit 2 n=1 Tax=Intoshia linei TaxID=1819745 RepID=A0A177AVA3_9BILA|nr:hypothetical protein A3Q56_06348 [Intoshia linei]
MIMENFLTDLNFDSDKEVDTKDEIEIEKTPEPVIEPIIPKIPTKIITESVDIEIKANVLYIDFEGRADGESIQRILQHIKPQLLVLVRCSNKVEKEMREFVMGKYNIDLLNIYHINSNAVHVAQSDKFMYQVKISDSLFNNITFKQAGQHSLAWIDGIIDLQSENVTQKDKDKDMPDLDNQDDLPVLLPTKKSKHDHKPVYINPPKLSNLKTLINAIGIHTEFNGGVLICNGNIALKRKERGLVEMEGVACEIELQTNKPNGRRRRGKPKNRRRKNANPPKSQAKIVKYSNIVETQEEYESEPEKINEHNSEEEMEKENYQLKCINLTQTSCDLQEKLTNIDSDIDVSQLLLEKYTDLNCKILASLNDIQSKDRRERKEKQTQRRYERRLNARSKFLYTLRTMECWVDIDKTEEFSKQINDYNDFDQFECDTDYFEEFEINEAALRLQEEIEEKKAWDNEENARNDAVSNLKKEIENTSTKLDNLKANRTKLRHQIQKTNEELKNTKIVHEQLEKLRTKRKQEKKEEMNQLDKKMKMDEAKFAMEQKAKLSQIEKEREATNIRNHKYLFSLRMSQNMNRHWVYSYYSLWHNDFTSQKTKKRKQKKENQKKRKNSKTINHFFKQ